MAKKFLIAAGMGAALMLAGTAVYEAGAYHAHVAPPSAEPVEHVLGRFDIDPSWVKSGTPTFRGTDVAQSPDGSSVTGLWSCDGPTTFEWQFWSDETVHLLEGQVHVEYLGKRFTLNPGDNAVFHSGTRAVWHVPQYAKKVFVVQQPGRLVRWWRKVFPVGA